MTTHDPQHDGEDHGDGSGLLPFEFVQPSRLRWEWGSRVVDDDETTLQGIWRHTGSSWNLSVFRVTSETVVVRVRTPVGRERFYEALQAEAQSALSRLEGATSWRRTA
ncbi:hypothetical protein ACERIT_15425 [Halopenitus sp. H-Gu1]|uniref:hypothetical protein n=1 Tax=Halopenitus sp. H-Gu1 TaxID=3242697 RepID=UPI00359F0888